MKRQHPLIAIVATREKIPGEVPYLHAVYPGDPAAVQQAGGTPLLLAPILAPAAVEELADLLDGLYLAGGEDVSAEHSPGVDPDHLVDTYPERDRLELALLAAAFARRKPILAICRGLQLLNVGLGGRLVDDIAARVPGARKHRVETGEPLDASAHPVRLQPGSRLAGIYGKETLQVNSFHHQAILVPGEGLNLAAFAPDGVVEAVELPDYPFCVGVQWHPEYPVGNEPGIEKIFSAFIAACR